MEIPVATVGGPGTVFVPMGISLLNLHGRIPAVKPRQTMDLLGSFKSINIRHLLGVSAGLRRIHVIHQLYQLLVQLIPQLLLVRYLLGIASL